MGSVLRKLVHDCTYQYLGGVHAPKGAPLDRRLVGSVVRYESFFGLAAQTPSFVRGSVQAGPS